MASSSDYGLFLGTTQIFDVSQLQSTDVTKPEFKELLVRLAQNVNSILLATNNKESAMFPYGQEFITGKTFSPNLNSNLNTGTNQRQGYRMVLNTGALANTGTTTIRHNIDFNNGYMITDIYGGATDPKALNYIPLPYPSLVAADIIEVYADGTNVYITTGSDWSAFTKSIIIIEYLKN